MGQRPILFEFRKNSIQEIVETGHVPLQKIHTILSHRCSSCCMSPILVGYPQGASLHANEFTLIDTHKGHPYIPNPFTGYDWGLSL